MNIAIIINPNSGKKKSPLIFNSIKPLLKEKNITYNIFETQYKNHATNIINTINIEDYDGLFMIGGDGTFHEIVTGLMLRNDGEKIPIGIIPGGSGNSFLYKTNIKNPFDITQKLLDFKKRKIDVIEIKSSNNTLYSINLVGWGLVTDIGKNAEKYRWLGTNRYTLISIIEIIKNKNRIAKLTINNKKADKNQFTFIIGCNTQYVGKGMHMAPKASTNDGLLDLIVVNGNLSRIKLFKTLPKLFKGTHINDPEVSYHQVSSFSIKTKNNELLNIDGELKGETPIDVRVIHNAIEVFN